MKFLLEHQATADMLREWTDQEVTIAGFFFWVAGDTLEKSHVGLLRSLLCQILNSQPHLAEILLLDEHASKAERPWNISRLNRAFTKVLGDSTVSGSFMFFIDGLDEFQGDKSDLILALEILNRSSNIKLCVSSRPWNVFETAYGSRASKLHLRLHQVNRSDIEAYVDARLNEDLGTKAGAEQQLPNLSATIVHKAEGVFLWVYLVVRRLREAFEDCWSTSEMLTLLKETPSELEDLIQGSFDSIHPSHREAAARTFLLLLECEGYQHGKLHLLWLSVFCRGICNSGRDAPLSQNEMGKLVDDADRSARKWCKDLVDVVRGGHAQKPERAREGDVWGMRSGKPSEVMLAGDPGDTLDSSAEMPREQIFGSRFQNYVHFPHRTIRDFIMKQKNDGGLSHHPGEDFCPAFALCAIIVEVARLLRPCGYAFQAIFEMFLILSSNVRISKQPLLIEMALCFNTVAHNPSAHDLWLPDVLSSLQTGVNTMTAEIEWSAGPDERTSIGIFMAYILQSGAHELFLLMFELTLQYHSPKCRQLWLAVALPQPTVPGLQYMPRTQRRGSGFELVTGRCGVVLRLLQHGADPNEPLLAMAKTETLWQQFLPCFHDCIPRHHDEIMLGLTGALLRHGADPKVNLKARELYKFLYEPERSVMISALLKDSEQPGSASILTAAPTLHPKLGCSSKMDKEKAASQSNPVIAAISAFEVPSSEFQEESRRFVIEHSFPIIRAQIIAASKGKAQKQKIENEKMMTTTTTFFDLRNMQRYLPC